MQAARNTTALAVRLAASCLLLALACSQQEVVDTVVTTNGHTISITADFHDDGIGIPLGFHITDPKGVLYRDGGGILVVDASMLRQGEYRFAVHESADGSIVGLYAVKEPDVILALIDFQHGIVYPSGSETDPADFFRLTDQALAQLRTETGRRDLRLLR